MNHNLSDFEWKLLNSYVGQGPIEKASIIFFGNEFGLANNDIQNYIKYVRDAIDNNFYYPFGNHWSEGFTVKEPNIPFNTNTFKCNSPFVKITAQFIMSLNEKDKNILNSPINVNEFILNRLHKEDTCIFNLRPLPRPTENHWIFANVNKKSYESSLRFNSGEISKFIKNRVKNLVRGFYYANNPLIIGTGDRHNKLKFFQKVLPKSNFKETTLKTGKKIYTDLDQKIILCDYFDYRIFSLDSLKEVFDIIIDLGV